MSALDQPQGRSQQLSTTDFGGLSIASDDRVLTPRRWTTLQSYWAAELLRDSPPGRVLELCAGVGHIGLLCTALAPRDLVMVDADPHACALARRNATVNRLVASIDVRHGDLQDVIRVHHHQVARFERRTEQADVPHARAQFQDPPGR